jgi:hypothetical protein
VARLPPKAGFACCVSVTAIMPVHAVLTVGRTLTRHFESPEPR